jgi:hypothetical protein
MNEPIEPQFQRLMNTLATVLDETFNEHRTGSARTVGFVLLSFNFGDKGRVNYISNADRDDVIATMKAFIARAEGRMPDDDTPALLRGKPS